MSKLSTIALAGALLSGLAGAAAGAEPMTMNHGAQPAADGTPADKAYAAANDAMMEGMDVKPTGNPDRDFVAMMLPHHRGAVDMARVEIQYGKDPMLRKLAADIIAAQEREIAQMDDWRKARGK